MRHRTVVVATLTALLAGCGEDDIVSAAREEQAAASAAAPTAHAGEPGGGNGGAPGIPAAPTPGVPAGAGTPPATAAGGTGPQPTGAPTPGIPEEPKPGLPGQPMPAPPGSGAAPVAGSTTPGVGDAPTPGIPEAPRPGAPGSAPPTTGPTIAVRGDVQFSRWKGGNVRIDAFDGDHSKAGSHPGILANVVVLQPGRFTLLVPQNAGKIFIEASVDEDGDGKPGPQDPQGKADRYPLTAKTTDLTDVLIVLTKREPPPGGNKDDF